MIDSGSTSNYLSAQCQTVLELKVRPQDDFEKLMLVDGTGAHAQRYAQFLLHCENYKTRILAQVFPNLHEELILGIPWLMKESWRPLHVA